MSKFTKRPVTIEAYQFTDSVAAQSIINWVRNNGGTISQIPGHDALTIETLEGAHTVSFEDWVIQGIAGEFYPCKPEIFEATYDEAVYLGNMSEPDRLALQRFESPNFAVQGERGEGAEKLRKHFYVAAINILFYTKPGKSRAVALTELETAMMWAIKAYYGAPGE